MLAIGWILNYLWYKQSMNKGFNLSRNIQSQNGEKNALVWHPKWAFEVF